MNKKKYYAMYKCPLCDTLLRTTDKPIEIPDDKVEDMIYRVIRAQQFMNNPALYDAPMHIVHHCPNGDIGMAQFVGFVLVSDNI